MPATVVLGAQWGDEGKGNSLIEWLNQQFGSHALLGGNNAGHTVVIGDRVLSFIYYHLASLGRIVASYLAMEW